MSFLGILIVTIIFSWFFVWFLRKYERVKCLIDKIQGPTALPIIGNLHQFRLNPDALLRGQIFDKINYHMTS
uniref:Cytochrome P450 n=1 Tax=Meloidogyne incognita TaxID=6306 RepID=A0A914NYW2_MELIC